jgi:hypothetical protein
MRALAILLFLALPACANKEPTVIDGSSRAAFEESVAQARRDLPDKDRLAYDRAIKSVGGRRFAYRDVDAAARVTFDGMTARQVVDDQRMREGSFGG